MDQIAAKDKEIAELRKIFYRAVETYPQNIEMPRALQIWWEEVYHSFIATNINLDEIVAESTT